MAGAVIAVYNLYRTARQGVVHRRTKRRRRRRSRRWPRQPTSAWHRWLEARPVQFTVLTFVAVLIGGIVEIVPTALIRSNVPTIASVKPYTPLEVEGRDLYIREGCVGCHSQMVRPIRSETERYGEYSKAGEFVYDHPFLWGSKRTGPDLHRVGGKYPDAWHFIHMKQPRRPRPVDHAGLSVAVRRARSTPSHIEGKIITLRRLGVPYPEGYERQAEADLRAQAATIADGLTRGGFQTTADREIVALIAYLQRLGTDIKTPPRGRDRLGADAAAGAGGQ